MKTFIPIIFILLAIGACKRTDEELMGPNQGYASENFAMVSAFSVNTDSVDFKKLPAIGFNARFNEKVSYTITIKGTQSGAIKHITGISEDIAESVWIGNSKLIFFTKELCSVQLTVLGVAGILGTGSVQILNTYQPEGMRIVNMETAGSLPKQGFFESGALIACKVVGDIPPLEGKYCWYTEGKDTKHTGGFIGLSYTQPAGTNANGKYYKVGTDKADDLWFNIFIYGEGDKNVATYIKFMQDDNGDNVHDGKKENGFELVIKDLSHTGWKLFSYKYSSIKLGGHPDFGGSGDNIHRPDRILQIEYALWGLEKDTPVKFIYDFAVFTLNKPFGQ